MSSVSQRRLDIERLLVEQQQEMRKKDDSILQISDNLRITQDLNRRLEIDLEVTKAAESRLLHQLEESREEVRKQMSLSDSIRRIESGLTVRIEEEKSSLITEKDSLLKTVDMLRKQLNERSLIEDQRIRLLEDDLRVARSAADSRGEELGRTREEYIREQVCTLRFILRKLL